jgi:hypothetical protein
MYNVLKQLENGEFVHVASRDELGQAVKLAHALNEEWPGEYEVRDSHTALVRLMQSSAQESNHQLRELPVRLMSRIN